jgi:hypothetical protein
MKIKIVLLSAVVTAFAFNSFAAQPLFSPRAQGNQIKVINATDATPASDVTHEDATTVLLSPRAAGNRIKVGGGVDTDASRVSACQKEMTANSRALTECMSHAAPQDTAVTVNKFQ